MNTHPEALSFRINDACAVLGIGRTSIYKIIACGKLKSITIAGRTLIPRAEIDRLIAEASGNA